ncbi:MAG: gamma-glutamyltransferase [Bryobacteraceae bacterium]
MANPPVKARSGFVVGQPEAAAAGLRVLEAGGNAVDAAVTAALVAGVVALPSCGIGGYGGAAAIAMNTGKIAAIDFNTEAPADFPPTPPNHGWLAAGTPGTLAGLDLALHRYGTLPLRRALQPSIRFATEGWKLSPSMAAAIGGKAAILRNDPASAQLLLPGGNPPPPGTLFRNPDLARMLTQLARDNSSEAFYRGPIARVIANAFARGGGSLSEKDLHAYEAREVVPLRIHVGPFTVATPPLASGGATTLQALQAAYRLPFDDPARRAHARLECLRLAWQDRLTLFGDPRFVEVPLERLLSPAHAEQTAARVRTAAEKGRPLDLPERTFTSSGTIHISAADAAGNLCAITLTHGDGFGACVTVPGLGLILGHGVSRFERTPGHPNAPGPRKSPLHNMCPTVVLRGRQPLLAIGATGGKKIPNAVFDVLTYTLVDRMSLQDAVKAPRVNTTGGLALALNNRWSDADAARMSALGFRVARSQGATIQAATADESASGQ